MIDVSFLCRICPLTSTIATSSPWWWARTSPRDSGHRFWWCAISCWKSPDHKDEKWEDKLGRFSWKNRLCFGSISVKFDARVRGVKTSFVCVSFLCCWWLCIRSNGRECAWFRYLCHGIKGICLRDGLFAAWNMYGWVVSRRWRRNFDSQSVVTNSINQSIEALYDWWNWANNQSINHAPNEN